MPGGNRKGPTGRGPMTGRKMGRCGGANADASARGPGFGKGREGGRGRGWRHRNRSPAHPMGGPRLAAGAPPTLTEKQELLALRQQAESIEQVVEELRSRIRDLDWPPTTEK